MKHQIEMRQLRYFQVLAEELHFRRAAERLYLAQPGLSRQIKRLEDALGYPLLLRDNRNVRLTAAGAYLKKEVDVVLRRLEAATTHGRMLHEGRAGRLRLGYVGSAMQNVIPELLVRFRKDYPEVQYDLEALDNPAQIAGLLAGEIDIGFVRLESFPEALEHRPVFVDTFSLVVPTEHPLTAATFTSMEQVAEQPFILFDPSYSQPYYDRVLDIFRAAGVAPRVAHRTVHATTIYRLVENGFGLSVVPTSLSLGYRHGVRFIELDGIEQRTTLSAVWRRGDHSPVAAGSFGRRGTGKGFVAWDVTKR